MKKLILLLIILFLSSSVALAESQVKIFQTGGATVKLKNYWAGVDYQIIYDSIANAPEILAKNLKKDESLKTSSKFTMRFLDKDGFELFHKDCRIKNFIIDNSGITSKLVYRGSVVFPIWLYREIASIFLDYTNTR
jgi:hypothetical protein